MSQALADDLAHVLDCEPLGLSCRELARHVGRRRGDVLAALRVDPRFEHSGRRRGSKWRIASETPASTPQAQLGSILLPWFDLDPSGVPVVGRRAEV